MIDMDDRERIAQKINAVETAKLEEVRKAASRIVDLLFDEFKFTFGRGTVALEVTLVAWFRVHSLLAGCSTEDMLAVHAENMRNLMSLSERGKL